MGELEKLLKQAGMDSYIYMQFMVGSLYSTVLKELGDAGICADLVFENPVEEYKKLCGYGPEQKLISSKLLNKLQANVLKAQQAREKKKAE